MKRVSYKTKEELQALRYIAKCYDFALTLCISLAFNQLDIAVIELREQKNFKQRLKQYTNNAVKEADLKRQQINEIMASKGFFESYADAVIDLAEKDVAGFKNSIRRLLEKHEVKNAALYAQIETTRCLLQTCVLDYNGIAEQVKKKFGYNLAATFHEYDISKASYWFEQASAIIYKNVDDRHGNLKLNTPATSRMWNKIHRKIADGEYIEECMRTAQKECPEFIENAVKTKEAI